jgi:hypothetical protein
MTAQVMLSDESRRRLEELARRTGRPADELASEAVDRLFAATEDSQAKPPIESPAMPDWKRALLGIEGMWANRDDLDAFYTQIRREADRMQPMDPPHPLEIK